MDAPHAVLEGRADLDFAVIGAQKSASTFVHQCLRRHPQIDMPPSESRTFEDPGYRQHGPGAAEELFGPRRADVRRGLKRPDHLADPMVPDRMRAACPDVRLIAVLRDPVPRAVSAYVDYVRLGFLPYLGLDDAFERLLSGDLERTHPRASDVLAYGRYGEHLERWLERFPRDQLAVVLQDDLSASPVSVVTGLFDFLGVDSRRASRLVEATPRANRGTYQPRRIKLQRLRNDHMFTYSADLRRREPRSVSPGGFAWAGAATLVDRYVLARFDHVRAPSLPRCLERRLREHYAEDRGRLERLLPQVPWP